MAKEPGAIILRGHPYLQRGKFKVGLPEGRVFTQNLAAIAYGAHSSLNLFLEESPEILSQPLNLTDVEAWAPGLARRRERKQPVQVYTALNGWAGIRASELTHHLGFFPFVLPLRCLACSSHLCPYIFHLPKKTAFISLLLWGRHYPSCFAGIQMIKIGFWI